LRAKILRIYVVLSQIEIVEVFFQVCACSWGHDDAKLLRRFVGTDDLNNMSVMQPAGDTRFRRYLLDLLVPRRRRQS